MIAYPDDMHAYLKKLTVVAPRRRWRTEFAVPELPAVVEHRHVDADVGPSELHCKRHKLLMMPMFPRGDELRQVVAYFGKPRCPASVWSCFPCLRLVVVTWREGK